jgi:drug/metabolite transporter (DMT)-like permease
VLSEKISVRQWLALLAVVTGIVFIYLPTLIATAQMTMHSSTTSLFCLLTAATLGGLALVLIQRTLRDNKMDPMILLVHVSCISLLILTPSLLFSLLHDHLSIVRLGSSLLPASMLAILQILNTYCIAQSGAIAVNVAGAISIPLSKVLEIVAAQRDGDATSNPSALFTNASLLAGSIAIGYGSHSYLVSKSKDRK